MAQAYLISTTVSEPFFLHKILNHLERLNCVLKMSLLIINDDGIFLNQTFRLEPLLQRIKEKRTAIVCPTIDSISDSTLQYLGGGAYCRLFLATVAKTGGFLFLMFLHFSNWNILVESTLQNGSYSGKRKKA